MSFLYARKEVIKTKTVQRTDSVNLDKATITPEGFLRDSPIIARTGILEYKNPDGSTRREFRPPEEVFKVDSLASFKGKPIVMGHGAGMITADNAKRSMIGTMLSEGIQDGDNVRADLMIHDKNALNSGRRALSVGYKVDEDWTPGEFNGIKYDLVQRNIVVNHLGLVNKGRAGQIARLTLDGDQIDEYEEEQKPMAKIRLDGNLEYEVVPEVIVAYDKLKADKADLIKTATDTKATMKMTAEEMKKMQTELDTKQAECDMMKAQIATHATDIQKVKKDSADAITTAVSARIELLKVAEKFKVDKADGLTDKEIKVAVIKSVRGDEALDLSGKSDTYIEAGFDFAVADGGTRADAMEKQRKAANNKTKTDEDDKTQISSSDARQKMIETTKNQYKGGK